MRPAVLSRIIRIRAGGRNYQILAGCATPLERVHERVSAYARYRGQIEVVEETHYCNLFAPGRYEPAE